jgi:hypothetical protein
MSRENPGVPDLTELLHDAVLHRGHYDRSGGAITLTFGCLRRGFDGSRLDDRVDVCLSGIRAIAVSYDPMRPEERPSTLRVPEGVVIDSLVPWPLPVGAIDASIDTESACDDVELAGRTDWLLGDLGGLVDGRYRMVLHADAGTPRIGRWITIGFDEAVSRTGDRPLPWREWADQYDAWWRGWAQHHGAERDENASPAPEDRFIPAGGGTLPTRTYQLPEPVIDLDAHDAPADLVAPVLAWFERQHTLDDESAEFVYPRSIASWWHEGRRASIVVIGVEHFAPDAEDPAESIITKWSFALHRRATAWTIRTYTSCAADGPVPTWAARWTTGRPQLR